MNITYIVYIKNTIMIVYYGQKGGGNTSPSPNTYNLIYPHCSQYCIMPIFTFHEIKLPCPLKQYSPYQHTDRLAPLRPYLGLPQTVTKATVTKDTFN